MYSEMYSGVGGKSLCASVFGGHPYGLRCGYRRTIRGRHVVLHEPLRDMQMMAAPHFCDILSPEALSLYSSLFSFPAFSSNGGSTKKRTGSL